MTIDTYKVHVNDREYKSWSFYTTTDFQTIDLPYNPVEHKLFTNDLFSIDTSFTPHKITNLHSSTRIAISIPGVLVLKDNKTYGRYSKNKKLLYKCIPDDMRLPYFLIPYELKNIGFSKVLSNQYMTFNFLEWTGKHPIGQISQMIGYVDILDNFYEYQLYCKSLNSSIQKFSKDTISALKLMEYNQDHDTFIDNISLKYSNIENRTDQSIWQIFTIDPPKSTDFDDAFSIRQLDDDIHQLSIYISNVTIWLDVLNLWDSFSQRISTIYLPDRKRPMLPTILSDCLCSLQANHTRIAFVMDVFIDSTLNEIIEIKYSNCKIRVYKNYCYEDADLLKNPNYLNVLQISKQLSLKYKYINNVRNSHEVVCYLMILMNFNSAKELLKHNNGIFRTTIINKNVMIPENLPEDVCKFVKIWNSATGQYIDASCLTEEQTVSHELLDMDAYIHITSPIRRLVDLLNIIKFQQNEHIIELSENANQFYNKWIANLEYINTTMRSIRKVQNDCSLLYKCSILPEIMDKLYEGYTFDKIVRNDGLFQYIVYLPELKLTSKITVRDDLKNYEIRQFKLFLFNNEDKCKKKIRLQITDSKLADNG